MELQKQSTKPYPIKRRTAKLHLDDYLSFIDSHKQIDLTIKLLNQVINMHGFSKFHGTPKKVLIDAVASIDLMDPSRSTLNDENVSSCAFMTLEEAIKDLADLNWQECCVTSLQTLNSVNYDLVLHNADASSSKTKPKISRKRRKFSTLLGVGGEGDPTAAAGNCAGFGGSQSVCSSAVVGEGGRNDGDLGATAGDFSESSSTFLSLAP